MLVVTSCGHQYPKPWAEGFLRFAPFFFCEVCGNAEAVPPDFVYSTERLETIDASELAEERGWPESPTNMSEAIAEVEAVSNVTVLLKEEE